MFLFFDFNLGVCYSGLFGEKSVPCDVGEIRSNGSVFVCEIFSISGQIIGYGK